MPDPDPTSPALPVTLRRRFHLLNARYNPLFTWSVAATLLLPLVLVASLLILGREHLPDGTVGELLETLRAEAGGEPVMVAGFAALPLVIIFLWLQFRHERLTLTGQGIDYRSPLRGSLGFLHAWRPDWRLPWREIAAAGLKEGGTRPQQLPWWRLVLRERNGTIRRLSPYNWYALPDRSGLGPYELARSDPELCRRAVERSPLYRELAARGLVGPDVEAPAEAEPDFDLSSHRGVWALVIGFFLVGGYAVVDTFFLTPWRAVGRPSAEPFLFAGLAGVALGAVVSRGVPRVERWAVVALFTAGMAGAIYPALLRVNAVTDPDGVSRYRYKQAAVGRFEPVDRPDMPGLVFTRGLEYWESLPEHGEMEFRLARGSPGFWQLDLADVRARQRAYYRGLREAGE